MFSGFMSNSMANADNSYSSFMTQTFAELFRCYPITMMNDRIRKDDANFGGKIFLPPSALNKLSMLNIKYPMLFEFTVNETGKITHAGVLEFTAEEGRAYLPTWMLDTLGVNPGALITIRSTELPQGQFVKLEPQSVDFLDISDPKAVLENALRNFSTLTVDDIIEISYNNKYYKIKILEVKPESGSQSICVVETDLVTDFAPPVGYVEPDYKAMQAEKEAEQNKSKKTADQFDPSIVSPGSMSTRINYPNIANSANETESHFLGGGQKLSGKKTTKKEPVDTKDIKINLEGEPVRLDLPEGQLFFGFPIVPPKLEDKDEDEQSNGDHFQGQGQSLRKANKRKTKKDHTSSKPKAPKSPEVIEID
ncbi:ubiquitin fusion degradation protein 1 [Monosporozyma unispora]|nr:ubiquitin fusion degradation protein [Kazachstania unispora]